MTNFLNQVAQFFAASFFFWTFAILAVILFFTFVENEWGGYATLLLIASFLLFNYLFAVPIIPIMSAHPLYTVLGVIGYFVIGTLWCYGKWTSYTQLHLDRYTDLKRAFLLPRDSAVSPKEPMPPQYRVEWKEYFDRNRSYGSYRIEAQPQITEHKKAAYIWITFWPFSFIWTLINDPVKRIVRWIYNRISTSLQKISDHIWRNTKEDFVDPNV